MRIPKSILLLVAVLLAVTGVGCTGPATLIDDHMTHSEVVEVDKSQDEIFVAANEWMARSFVNSEEAVRFSDKEAGKITGRYVTQTYSCGIATAHFELNWDVTAKDGRYRFRQDPLHAFVQAMDVSNKSQEVGRDCLEKALPEIESMRKSMKEYIASYDDSF